MRLLHTISAAAADGAYVLDGCVCRDRHLLCLSATDRTLRCYDLATAALTHTLRGHTCAIRGVTSTPSQPSLLYSAQEDTGVMVTDLRQPPAPHFLSEFCGSGAAGGTVGVTPSGTYIGVAVGGDAHLVDTRTWRTVHVIARMHLDEITRLRFLDEAVYCSAGEDQMINFIDAAPAVAENDILLQAISCGEVVTKMTAFPEAGGLGLVGSCENAYVCPFNLQEREARYARPDPATYLVDMCLLGGELHLVRGVRDDDGNAGPLSVMGWETRSATQLPQVHSEICRVAVGVGDRLITGGEDNIVAFWSLDDTQTTPSTSVTRNNNNNSNTASNNNNNSGGASAAGAHRQRAMMPLHKVTRPLRSRPYTK